MFNRNFFFFEVVDGMVYTGGDGGRYIGMRWMGIPIYNANTYTFESFTFSFLFFLPLSLSLYTYGTFFYSANALGGKLVCG